MKFLDQAKIYLKSGTGGSGCLSFRREKYIEYGGPNGGNGGCGGHVIFVAIANLNTLIDFRYQQHFRAQNGLPGEGSDRTGKDGEDCIINVPVGTQILSEDKSTVICDMTEDGQELVILKGGDNGFGNAHFKSSTNRAPRKTTPGWPGDEIAVWLRLKLIADVGLVGLPNAGKSTFLAASSRAKPKIADYPFTTIHPNLGVVYVDQNEFVVADIPGLIEGAHEGLGIGDRFLGHVERTRVLLHLIDCTSDDIINDYKIVRHELKEYGGGLSEKPEIIALNKADALGDELAEDQRQILEKALNKPVRLISAVSHDGVRDTLFELLGYINTIKKDEKEQITLKNEDYVAQVFDPLN